MNKTIMSKHMTDGGMRGLGRFSVSIIQAGPKSPRFSSDKDVERAIGKHSIAV
ncbi:hypothetical protein ASPCADRAFT_211772 [Aspergillus carbonarius ITEM 5010]|uniref:Uncharacterized protein n=1 Tax=Aspergillus carbonarius (strain ITEM 5010) TaxID=602072 RepID=A0A1R3R8L2_ASPC5|nr:hypothetical protein ASPCADRAFT_211772 [Aspergillus carbonarius ITEM 5010]